MMPRPMPRNTSAHLLPADLRRQQAGGLSSPSVAAALQPRRCGTASSGSSGSEPARLTAVGSGEYMSASPWEMASEKAGICG